jgi:hypothetical protein
MSEELTHEPSLREQFELVPPDEQADAAKTAVYGLVEETCRHYNETQQSFVKLGVMLDIVREKQFWREWGFKSIGEFMDSIKEIGRASLYHYAQVARTLGPLVDENKLVQMGLKDADVLMAFPRQKRKLPDEFVDRALDPNVTSDQLHAEVVEALGGPPPEEHKYYTMTYYATKEGQAEIEKALAAVTKIEGLKGSTQDVLGRGLELIAAEYISSCPEIND